MTNIYHQFKILYSLYDKLHKGGVGWQNKTTIINEEEIRYIPKQTINADIIHLEADGLIKVNDSPNLENLKITAKGIGIINRILIGYREYLQNLGDEQSTSEFKHISAILSEDSKRSQMYYYIIHRENVFKEYLFSSNVFEIDTMTSARNVSSAIRKTSDLVTNLIDSLQTLNELCQTKFGCKIFKDNSKLLNDLRRNVDDESSFVLLLARIASIIDNAYNDDMKKQLSKNPPRGSINLIEAFLSHKNVGYDKSSLDKLRKLHKLRSTMPPIHDGKQDAIAILKEFGIDYPHHSWEEAGMVCIREFVSSICKLVADLS